jgi:hypothetical protein
LKREDLRGKTAMAEMTDRRLANRRLQPLGHLTADAKDMGSKQSFKRPPQQVPVFQAATMQI